MAWIKFDIWAISEYNTNMLTHILKSAVRPDGLTRLFPVENGGFPKAKTRQRRSLNFMQTELRFPMKRFIAFVMMIIIGVGSAATVMAASISATIIVDGSTSMDFLKAG